MIGGKERVIILSKCKNCEYWNKSYVDSKCKECVVHEFKSYINRMEFESRQSIIKVIK
jgi:hypothetical protein